MNKYLAFTLKSQGLLNMLKTDAFIVSEVRDKTRHYMPKMWRAIWDTGATNSCISDNIAKDIGLIPVGTKSISTANGIVPADNYLVNIGLPNKVMVENVVVSSVDLGSDIDVLIGMDVIRHGDFAITNEGGKTTFSFRIPSCEEIDYVGMQNVDEAAATQEKNNS